ncbi:MAG: pyruvate kinase [Deltaproteobacteria bacterium]|nr:pyruvate kinase [Deltaproteobacteria bacterium]
MSIVPQGLSSPPRTADGLAPRQTKIVATVGPASSTPEIVRALVRAGMDVARLNFSHGTHDDHRRRFELVREASIAEDRPVAILQDLQGPKIRLGTLDGKVRLEPGATVLVSSNDDFVGTRERLPTTYHRLADDVRPGEPLLLADGALELEVLAVLGRDLECRVKVGGVVSSKKGLNMPASKLGVSSFVEKDLEDLTFGLELGVDYVALSFVRHAREVLALRHEMERRGRVVPIVAKIEKPEAVENLGGIVEVSDALMVARGDLGVELPAERVPAIQRRVIREARARSKPCIVATQMLVSMTKHSRPTHAEVSDVANAVFEGADAVMLSEETASGEFPVEAVEMMAAIAQTAEAEVAPDNAVALIPELANSHPGAISRAAAQIALDLRAASIIAFTHEGLGPRLIGHFRPPCPILGFSIGAECARQMSLYWGVRPLEIPEPRNLEELVEAVERAAISRGLLRVGDTVVITSKLPFRVENLTNVLKLHSVGERDPPS